ncbi:hypothetical protein LCGC14_2179000, partial [marine sediment metagenome]
MNLNFNLLNIAPLQNKDKPSMEIYTSCLLCKHGMVSLDRKRITCIGTYKSKVDIIDADIHQTNVVWGFC